MSRLTARKPAISHTVPSTHAGNGKVVSATGIVVSAANGTTPVYGYRLASGGTEIDVASGEESQARVALAQKGLPNGDFHRAISSLRGAETHMPSIEFFFDYGSPASYLAYTQMPGLAQRTRASIVYRPMLLGGVFKATGNQSPINIPAKGAWLMGDLPRFARRYGVPYVRNPHFPINRLNLMRGAIAAEMEGRLIPASTSLATPPASAPLARILSRSSAVISGFSCKNARAFSLPWPR